MNQVEQFNNFLNNDLNPEQKEAVLHETGPLLVIAGAGSGKTRVITSRITHLLLNKNIRPEQIVALTFTNKAAKEMKERITHFFSQKIDQEIYQEINSIKLNNLFIGTFHAFCLRLLKSNLDFLNLKQFTILDENDQHALLKRVIEKNDLHKKITPQSLSYQISQIKNSSLFNLSKIQDPLLYKIYLEYEEEKEKNHSLDFDDLLIKTLNIFKNKDDFKKLFQENTKHILVDEYQDTNIVQHELLKELSKYNNSLNIDSICVVGDEDQSIYSWRGATIENIINFKKDFINTKSITIEQNYRSVDQILEIANNIIQSNIKRNPKNLWSTKKASNRSLYLQCLSGYQESEAISLLINNLAKSQKLNSIAILYRTHYQSRIIEEALIRHSIAYKIIGGITFYERKEIKDIIAYLKLVINPYDKISFFRVINCPLRGLGEKFIEEFYAFWEQEILLEFNQAINLFIEKKLASGTKLEALKNFNNLFNQFLINQAPSKIIEHFITKTDYISYLKTSFETQEAENKIENIKEFIRSATYFEQNNSNNSNISLISLVTFLDEIALLQEKMNKQESNEQVTLMTLHAAKGLEFDTVIINGIEEGIIPSARSLHEEDLIEEERRLFYVGITRAKERLILTSCKFRNSYGSMTEQVFSRFLSEIPKSLIKIEDLSNYTYSQISIILSNWLNIRKEEIFTFSSVQNINTKNNISDIKNSNVSYPVDTLINPEIKFIKNQPVIHQKFGIGIIKEIEKKGESKTHLLIQFKSGLKKIDSQFIKLQQY